MMLVYLNHLTPLSAREDYMQKAGQLTSDEGNAGLNLWLKLKLQQ
jgi:hypothetical protein